MHHDMKDETARSRVRPGRRRVGALAAAVAIAAVPVLTTAHAASRPAKELVSVKEISATTLPDDVDLALKGASDLGIIKVTVRPGGSIPWHSHAGPVLMAFTGGVATDYEADGTSCARRRHKAGEATFEPAGHVHTMRNEGRQNVVFYAVSLFPKGSDGGQEEPRPAGCPH
jgi:quercetin dioxygenase-like cupin family protein